MFANHDTVTMLLSLNSKAKSQPVALSWVSSKSRLVTKARVKFQLICRSRWLRPLALATSLASVREPLYCDHVALINSKAKGQPAAPR